MTEPGVPVSFGLLGIDDEEIFAPWYARQPFTFDAVKWTMGEPRPVRSRRWLVAAVAEFDARGQRGKVYPFETPLRFDDGDSLTWTLEPVVTP